MLVRRVHRRPAESKDSKGGNYIEHDEPGVVDVADADGVPALLELHALASCLRGLGVGQDSDAIDRQLAEPGCLEAELEEALRLDLDSSIEGHDYGLVLPVRAIVRKPFFWPQKCEHARREQACAGSRGGGLVQSAHVKSADWD